ncbi:hypothetical protein, partial [Mesorhizobium sp.]
LAVSLLASVVHARAEGPVAIANHLVAIDDGFCQSFLGSGTERAGQGRSLFLSCSASGPPLASPDMLRPPIA